IAIGGDIYPITSVDLIPIICQPLHWEQYDLLNDLELCAIHVVPLDHLEAIFTSNQCIREAIEELWEAYYEVHRIQADLASFKYNYEAGLDIPKDICTTFESDIESNINLPDP
ncbi:hypothetical protein KI387_025112, partial [Taxus chinensis]